MKNKKMKLSLMRAVCWIMTVLLICVIGWQIWYTYDMWEEMGALGRTLYIIFQVLVLLYATANLVAAWSSYEYEKYIYKKDLKI